MLCILIGPLRYETIKQEFIKQGGLHQVKQFSNYFGSDSFKLRDAALKVIAVIVNCGIEDSRCVTDRTSVRSNKCSVHGYISSHRNIQYTLCYN